MTDDIKQKVLEKLGTKEFLKSLDTKTPWYEKAIDLTIQECEKEFDKKLDKQIGMLDILNDRTLWFIKNQVKEETAQQIFAELEKIRKQMKIGKLTHLCIRKIPKNDKELVAQLRGAQGNVFMKIEKIKQKFLPEKEVKVKYHYIGKKGAVDFIKKLDKKGDK